QIGAIQQTLWEIATIEARLKFDEGSKNISAELAIVPLKDTKLANVLNNPPPGLAGKDTVLLTANAPVNAAFRVNAMGVHAFLKKYGVDKDDAAIVPLFQLLDGETTLASDPGRDVVFQ